MKKPLRSLWLGAVLLLSSVYVSATPDDPLQAWAKFDFTQQTVTLAQLNKLTLDELSLLRGLVFGRHGRVFKDANIRQYLAKQPWYKPNPTFSNTLLNNAERHNLDLIREAEADKHEYIQPGDLRFWSNRVFTADQLGEHTAAEWRVLAAEIEAVRGKRFDDEFLQQYFADRYWYQPRDDYDPKQLSNTERLNLATIVASHNRTRKLAVSPGDMEIFQEQPLRPEMLKGLTLNELRLMRNEFYARRGKAFNTAWIAQYFFSQPWYEVVDDQTQVKLTPQEEANVKVIVTYENQLRASLSTKPVDVQLLEGTFKEDAMRLRQEIFARRGKIFPDKATQRYFASFDWYKPNPKFSEATLNPVERQNVATILKYEKTADSVLDAVEG